MSVGWHILSTKPCALEFLVFILHYLKLELPTQFPALNDDEYLYLFKIDISEMQLFY